MFRYILLYELLLRYYNGLIAEMRELINKDLQPEVNSTTDPDFYKEIDQFLTKPWEYLE